MKLIIANAMPNAPGFVQVGTTSGGKLILDASRDAVLLESATVLSEGAGRYARAALGTHADLTLDAVWSETTTTGAGKSAVTTTETVRGKVVEADAATTVEADIVPHRWLGE